MEYIRIGTIINTHGIRGEVKIKSFSDFDEERYQKGNTVYIDKDGHRIERHVKSYRVHKGFPLVSFEECKDINDVEPFKNCDLFILAAQRKPLTDGRHYVSDLIGMQVLDEEGNPIGKVIEIEETLGANSNIRIKKTDGKESLVPYVPAFVKSVDEENNQMVIHVIEGLL